MKKPRDKLRERNGFTLAELPIVVAIIAVLVAVAVPVFMSRLNKSKYATDVANARSIYAELNANYLATGGKEQAGTSPIVTLTTARNGSEYTEDGTVEITIEGVKNSYKVSGNQKLTINSGTDNSSAGN